MKKRDGVLYSLSSMFVVLIIILSSNVAIAANQTTVNMTGFDKSDACLKQLIDNTGYSSMTPEQLAFSLLALGYDSARQNALKSELEAKKDQANACWPTGACTIKETALVLLAYDYMGADTSNIQSWLLNRTAPPTELVWYLQIENPSNEQAACTITYDGSSKSVIVGADKTITGSPGACFTFASNANWLEVKSSCYDKEFNITCDKDFLTSTLFRRTSDPNKIFVPAITNTGSPNGKTTEKIKSVCFKQGSSCSYEGSLWAAIALDKKDSTFRDRILPYLMALAPDSSNARYLPSAFLYSLTGFEAYFTELTGQQKTEGYWQTTADSSKRYYDTAAALLSLYGKSSGQADEAITYLLQPNVQGEGCWGNNLRDTAFILYASNPKAASGGGVAQRTLCTSIENHPEYSCISSTECEDINGTSLPNFYCIGTGICCDKTPVVESCSAQGGVICSASQDCSAGGFARASDSSYCCVGGECREAAPAPTATACEQAAYTCKFQCNSSEEKQPYSCGDTANECCSSKPAPGYWWIWLLVILIIIIALAILFRKQLSSWWFKVTGKMKKGPVAPQLRPAMPPSAQRPMFGQPARRIIPGMIRRPMPPGARPAAMPRRPFAKERELDETLKRLRDMSK